MKRRIPEPIWNEERQEWRVQVRWTGYAPISEWFHKAQYDQACQRMEEIYARKERQSTLTDSRELLGPYLKAWLASRHLRKNTRVSYRGPVAHIIAELGQVELRKLTREQITRLLTSMRDGSVSKGNPHGKTFAAQTVRHVFTVLNAALQDALEDHRLAVNPANFKSVRRTLPTVKRNANRSGNSLRWNCPRASLAVVCSPCSTSSSRWGCGAANC
jgi:hypothetical protein